MPGPVELCTERLLLRGWRESDLDACAALNADPQVMRYFPRPQGREDSQRSIAAWQAELARRGYSNWAVERKDDGSFIGFVGLTVPWRCLPFTPCTEIGWRLAPRHWGRGYATEAARAALDAGFERFGLHEIVAYTALINRPSRAVMERLGMTNSNQDFDHPAVPDGHPLRRHCLYRSGGRGGR